jgi:hypothetical protein
MNKAYICLTILCVSVLHADVLYYQIPDTLTAGGFRCQLDTVWPFEVEIVDDITPTGSGWQIDSIVAWFCNWGGFISWDYVPNIHFLVYQDSAGRPADSPIVEVVIEQSEYSAYYINGPDPSRWRVEMKLPVQVIIDTNRHWIKFQPSCYFSLYGATGNMGDLNCGNGQEFFFRCALIGYPYWVTATVSMGYPYEIAFLLFGEISGGVVGDSEYSGIPGKSLIINYSNPVTSATELTYVIPARSSVKLDIYDIEGMLVHTPVRQIQAPGSHTVHWDVTDLANGVYFLHLQTESQTVVHKVVVLH